MVVKKAAGKLRSARNSIEVSIQAKERIMKNIQAKPLQTSEALSKQAEARGGGGLSATNIRSRRLMMRSTEGLD